MAWARGWGNHYPPTNGKGKSFENGTLGEARGREGRAERFTFKLENKRKILRKVETTPRGAS